MLDALAREEAQFPPGAFGRGAHERALNDWTVDDVFGRQLGLEGDVLDRPTPDGPEVLGVGFDEIAAPSKGLSAEERGRLET